MKESKTRPLIMVLASLATLVSATSVSSAGSLAYNIGAGYVAGYSNSDATGMAYLGVSWLAREHFEITADVAYIHYQKTVGTLCTGPAPCPRSDLETSFVPIGLGLIGYLRGPARSGPYGEFSPSLVVNRWSMEGSAGSGEFTNVTAGLRAGLGVRLAINENGRFDVGVLYVLSGSGDLDDPTIREFSEGGRFEGLKKAVPFARLSITL